MGCEQGHTPHAAISDPKSPGAAGSLPVSAQHPNSLQGLTLKEAPAPPRGDPHALGAEHRARTGAASPHARCPEKLLAAASVIICSGHRTWGCAHLL